MKFYIASKLENVNDVRALKVLLESWGWTHSYDWTVHGSVQRAGCQVIRDVAAAEAQGVADADVVIVLLPGGRGTHVEIGMGIAAAKPVYIDSSDPGADFGDDGRTCAFYHHPLVTKCWTRGELLQGLRDLCA